MVLHENLYAGLFKQIFFQVKTDSIYSENIFFQAPGSWCRMSTEEENEESVGARSRLTGELQSRCRGQEVVYTHTHTNERRYGGQGWRVVICRIAATFLASINLIIATRSAEKRCDVTVSVFIFLNFPYNSYFLITFFRCLILRTFPSFLRRLSKKWHTRYRISHFLIFTDGHFCTVNKVSEVFLI